MCLVSTSLLLVEMSIVFNLMLCGKCCSDMSLFYCNWNICLIIYNDVELLCHYRLNEGTRDDVQ